MPHSAQLAFNLPFDSARWKGAKYSQYFGLSLKPGNQWCFLLIREFVGKCSWISRGSSSLSDLLEFKRFFLLGGHYVFLVVLGSRPSLGVVKAITRGRRSLIGNWRGQEGHSLDWFRVWGRRGQEGHSLGWLLGSGLLLGIVEVKRVVLLSGYLGWVFTGKH
ncbi:hypothetical protein EDB89DRAFT_1906288 [Lactarius sanguifluus]|nr:hypothetical protein EDB89DRAFT_1906288 [Lactarius sanguifluus]